MTRLALPAAALALALAACSDDVPDADPAAATAPADAAATDPAYAEPMAPIEGEGDFTLAETVAYACDDGVALTIDWLTRDGPDGLETQARAAPAGGTPVTLKREERFGPLVGNGNSLVGGLEAQRVELNGHRCERSG